MKKITLGENVYCSQQRCGEATHIVVNPETRQVTHLVVKEGEPPHVERLVPIDAVSTMSPERIQLRCSPDDLKFFDPFVQIERHSEMVPDYENAASFNGMWTYVPEKRVWIETGWEQVPCGELALHPGVHVQATDGPAGCVTGLKVDSTGRNIKQLVIRQGLPWDHQYIAVPLSQVENAEENVVYLKLDKRSLDAMAEGKTNQHVRQDKHLAEHI